MKGQYNKGSSCAWIWSAGETPARQPPRTAALRKAATLRNKDALRRPIESTVRLRSGTTRERSAPKNRRQHIPHIIGGAYVTSASLESGHPHLFIRDAMGANDGQLRKVAVEAFHIGEPPVLNVEHNRLRTIAGYIVPQFFTRTSDVY